MSTRILRVDNKHDDMNQNISTHSPYFIKFLWSDGMLDNGSGLTFSHRDSEKENTFSNVAIGIGLEFPL